MPRKPFSSYQVLQAWLETQIGSAKHLRPSGYEMPGEGSTAWPDTCARARVIVEGLPMYDLLRRQLVEFCQVGLDDLGLVGDFLIALNQYLKEYPFYPTSREDLEDTAKTPVVWISCADAATLLGCTSQRVRQLVFDRKLIHTITYRRNLQLQRSEVEMYKQSISK